MALNLVSPGVRVKEIDLTIGRIDDINDQVGAIAGPFEKGPVNVPILVETEAELLDTFGSPKSSDAQYEYWMTASAFLSYGGVLRVIRTSGEKLSNANAPVGAAVTNLSVESSEDYFNNHTTDTEWHYAARNPGSWANDLKVCVIDGKADQRLAIGTDGLAVGYAVTAGFSTSVALTDGTVGVQTGYLKGQITQVNQGSFDVKILSKFNSSTNVWSDAEYEEGSSTTAFQGYEQGVFDWQEANQTPNINYPNRIRIFNNSGVEQRVERTRFQATVGIGSTMITFGTDLDTFKAHIGDQIKSLNNTFVGNIVGYTTGVGDTKVIMDTASTVAFANTDFIVSSGIGSGINLRVGNTVHDWYQQQKLGLSNSNLYWKNLAPAPGTSAYAKDRNSRFDEVHVVVVDDTGAVTGTAGNIIEKWTGLSKASDAKISPSTATFYKDYIANFSEFIYGGAVEVGIGLKYSTTSGYTVDATGTWGQKTQGVTFNGIGARAHTLASGNDYGSVGSYDVSLGDVISSYTTLENPAEYDVNYLIQGPSGGTSIYEAQAKANKLIQIASIRKDCIACISPYRSGVVGLTNSDTQTNNIVTFYDSLTSSSYAVFDSGYKYTFDRFNNTFRYIPLNGDTAGIMARTSINSYPWFSPAGSQRGTVNNAIKLAYNPSQAQRDLLYPKRINPVVFSAGAGMILFGDKTALKEASAFDRINVRRLFLNVEKRAKALAEGVLFEQNDYTTRSNFNASISSYLSEVQARRGVTDFLVVCDESNNTPEVIDRNEFVAELFLKPTRSINYVTVTVTATRTGVSFSEVVGTV